MLVLLDATGWAWVEAAAAATSDASGLAENDAGDFGVGGRATFGFLVGGAAFLRVALKVSRPEGEAPGRWMAAEGTEGGAESGVRSWLLADEDVGPDGVARRRADRRAAGIAETAKRRRLQVRKWAVVVAG